MKKLFPILFLSILFFSFITFKPVATDYIIKSPVEMTVKGSSNLHDWESKVEKVSGTAAFVVGEDGTVDIQSCVANISVKSIKSSKGSIMDNKTWDALKADDYPTITYRFRKMNSITRTIDGFKASVNGDLTIAGVTCKIDMDIKGKTMANGDIEINGSKSFKMTDYKIDPPKALLGTLTTGNDVTIDFRVRYGMN